MTTNVDNKQPELPPEVLARVFINLSKESQLVCLSVCKTWYLTAGRLCHQTIQIDETYSGSKISKILNCLKTGSSLLAGYFIMSISIEKRSAYLPYLRRDCATQEQFSQLLELCPNLQEIAISFDSIYWKYLHQIPKVTELRCIREVCKFEAQRFYKNQYFYQVAYKYKKSITDLEIHCSCDIALQEGFDDLFDYLSAFPTLENLAIMRGSQQYLIHFHQLLDACKQLKKLNYQLDHPFFQSINEPNHSTAWPTYPSMQELNLFLPCFDIKSLHYVICRFTNIRRLTLRLNQNDEVQRQQWNDTMIHSTTNTVHEFFRKDFMQMIETLDYFHILFHINGPSYLEELASQFYKIKCTTKDTTMASYTVHDGRAERTQINLKKERKICGGLSLAIDYTFVRDLSSYSSISHIDADGYSLPYVQHLQSYGAHLKVLKITHRARVKRENASNVLLVLRFCSNLEHLVIHIDLDYLPYDVSPSYQSGSIAEEWNTNQMERNPRLRALTLNGTYITSLVLKTIAVNNPNIEKISLIKCILQCNEQQVADGSNNIFVHFDLQPLKLKSLVYDVSSYRPITEMMAAAPTICVAIEREGGFCNYYLAGQQCNQHGGKLFKHISQSYYNEFIVLEKRKAIVLWFTLTSLDMLELQNGRNKAFVQTFSFPDKTPMVSV